MTARCISIENGLIAESLVNKGHGAKAFNCSLMKQAGMPVPDLLILDTTWKEKLLDPCSQKALFQYIDSKFNISSGVVVRSSSIKEDTHLKSYAGMFTTQINCINHSQILDAIKLTQEHADKLGSESMNIILMPLVKAAKSGVTFSTNPITLDAEFVTDAAFGLGEGVVSGSLRCDRYRHDQSQSLVEEVVATKKEQVIASPTGMTSHQTIPKQLQDQSVLSPIEQKELISQVEQVKLFFAHNVDVEWAFDDNGKLWILQARPISTISNHVLPPFKAPGDGPWKVIDHIPNPGTLCFEEYYYQPMERGWNESAEEIGLLNRVSIRNINRFMYYQMGGVTSPEEFGAMCAKNQGYWTEKRYLLDYENWKSSVKKDSIKRISALQEVDRQSLSNQELAEHTTECFKTVMQMVFNHHRYTYTSFIPTGDFICHVKKWVPLQTPEILSALTGTSPERLHIAFHEDRKLKKLISSLDNPQARKILDIPKESNDDSLQMLKTLSPEINSGVEYLLEKYGYRIINGYDIGGKTYIESPSLILSILSRFVKDQSKPRLNRNLQRIREMIPETHRNQFEEKLEDARTMDLLRQERGFYCDLWAVGVLRHCYLEVGRRTKIQEEITEASLKEVLSFLENDVPFNKGELLKRLDYRKRFSVRHTPEALGPAPQVPDLASLPEDIQRSTIALMTAITLAVDKPACPTKEKSLVTGVPASLGKVEANVCVITNDQDYSKLQEGEIAVIHQATASLNVVIPILSGIITEFGGVLSHPAILAREYQIPCLVGCEGATTLLKSGMRVRLDSEKSKVEDISL